MVRSRIFHVSLLILVFGQGSIAFGWEDPERKLLRPGQLKKMLDRKCGSCHDGESSEGDFHLDRLTLREGNEEAEFESLLAVHRVLVSGEMPPPEAEGLRPKQRQRWIGSLVPLMDRAYLARQSQNPLPNTRRLSRDEYIHTMRDLLQIDMDYGRDIPPDPPSSDGFSEDANALSMTPEHLTAYLDTARRAMDRLIVQGPAPQIFRHSFTESNVKNWKGKVEFSNRLGRPQEWIVKMVDEYPESGEFIIKVRVSAELRKDRGFPLMEVELGYRPDTEILFNRVALREIREENEQTFEFRGRVENFPLPVRGQGKFPGLVIKIRNAYDDGSPFPKGAQEKDKEKRWIYEEEPHLPKLVIHEVTFEGPFFDSWPPANHRQILFESEDRHRDETRYVHEVLSKFMEKAYRRPVEESEVAGMMEIYDPIRRQFPSFEEAIREILALVLIRPEFLYLANSPDRSIRDPWSLASRLSYLFWNTMPDDELLALARSGALLQPERLSEQVDRLLGDIRSTRFVFGFVDQWLQLNRVDSIAVSKERLPPLDDPLKEAMKEETRWFFKEILDRDHSALLLLDSDFAMLNERMARHYDIREVFGNAFRRVDLPEKSHRGGVLGHASILLSNSTGADSHPVRRAVWLRDRLLNDPPGSPPPNVPPLKKVDKNFGDLSIREQLEIHRNEESCDRCHRKLDPWGLAMENFDPFGRWRNSPMSIPPSAPAKPLPDSAEWGGESETKGLKGIDAMVTLPDGTNISDAEGLKDYLLRNRSKQFARSLVARLLSYASGRTVDWGDQKRIDALTTEFIERGYSIRRLIHQIVQSPSFQGARSSDSIEVPSGG